MRQTTRTRRYVVGDVAEPADEVESDRSERKDVVLLSAMVSIL